MSDTLFKAVVRKKKVDDDNVEKSALARVLTIFDLTALGVGATLGIILYSKISLEQMYVFHLLIWN